MLTTTKTVDPGLPIYHVKRNRGRRRETDMQKHRVRQRQAVREVKVTRECRFASTADRAWEEVW